MDDDGLNIFRDQRVVPEDRSRRLVPAAIVGLVVLCGLGIVGLLWVAYQAFLLFGTLLHNVTVDF